MLTKPRLIPISIDRFELLKHKLVDSFRQSVGRFMWLIFDFNAFNFDSKNAQ